MTPIHLPAPAGPLRIGGLRVALLAVVLLAVVLAGGCSKAGPTEVVATDCASAAPDSVVVTAAVRGDRADPAPHRVPVPLNKRVQLQVTADKAVEVHVHGYDLEYDVTADRPGCIAFTADQAGLFDVEAHPDTLLVQLEVR